jgi:mono/diheme cytochrome c family protein
MKILSAKMFLPRVAVFFAVMAALPNLFAADVPQTLPPPANVTIDFDRDIQPIFEDNCLRCHGPQKPKSHFRLDYREGALAGGDNNTNDVIPGDSTNSLLIAYVAYKIQDMEMPPVGRGKQLTPDQISLLRAWIDQGANWSITNELPSSSSVLKPIGGETAVHRDKAKFRELEGTREGASGGVDFSTTEQDNPNEKISLDAHLIVPNQDFGFQLALDRTDVGFIHTGFDQWRKYYATDGGYDPAVVPSQFNFNDNLYVNNGHAWIDAGLELPHWPQIVFGYDYRYQIGNESTLDWGYANGKNIYPASQMLDEQTHAIKLDVTENLNDWRLENLTRVEFYTERNQGAEGENFTGGTTLDESITNRDDYHQVHGMDTLTLEKQLQDWWFINGGFYFSRLDGSDFFSQATVSPLFGFSFVQSSQKITLSRQSEIFSVASLFTPLNYLTLSLGTQNEWTREDGFSDSIPDLELGGIIPANSSLGEFKASQNANFRFTRIPFTVVSGDAQFSEDNYSIFQADGMGELQRETAANNFRYDLKTGFSVSPWQWTDLTMQYERQSSDTEYNQLQDSFQGITGPTNGYPAFILERLITSDQFETKLALYPATWLKTTLTYQITDTGYSSKTDPAFDFEELEALVSEGGSIVDGHYHLQTYGIAATVTPFRQLYFSGAFTYSRSRVTTADNGDPSIVPFEGNIFTATTTATWLLNLKTSLQLSYNFSSANYSENNAVAGIPAGLDYQRHELIAGVTRKFTENLSGSLRYGFSQYSEPSTANSTNFRANSIFGTVTVRF